MGYTESGIREEVTLTFDPARSDNPLIRAVFEDDIARNLWLGVKQSHLTNQYFNEGCLRIAAWIKKQKTPLTESALTGFLWNYDMIGTAENDFAKKLLPFATGEKAITYTISPTPNGEGE